MKLRKTIKRIVALGVGATMLGATMLGATAAADLANWPNQVVQNSVLDALLVVGSGNSDDNLALTDIATHIFVAGTGAGATTVVTGDAWKVGTSSLFLEMAPNNESTVEGENINDMATYIDKGDLSALATGTYSTNEKEVTYNQYLYFDSEDQENEIVGYMENDDDVTADFFYIKNSGHIARYKLEFTSQAESDVTDSTGSSSTTGDYLDDFEDTKLNMFGIEYDIVLARRDVATGAQDIRLLLMGGSVKNTLSLDETETIQFNGKDYVTALDFVDQTYAKFTVNGEDTNKLKVGDTRKLSDGTELGVTEILYQSFAGGVMKVTFFIGVNKVELKDSNVTTDATNYGSVIVGSEDIDGTLVLFTGSDDNTKFKISTIEINMTAEDDYFVPAGGSLSETIAAAGEEKEVLFTENWDMEYKGLSDEATHDIKLDSSTDRKYQLKFFDGDNNAVTLPLAYANAQYNISFGEETQGTETKTFRFGETHSIYKNNYFVVTGGTPASGTGKTYALQYKGGDKFTDTNPKVKFKDLGSGDTLEYSVPTTAEAANKVTDIKLGGYTFRVENASTMSSDNFQIRVAMNGDTDVTDGNPTIVDYYGAQITITNQTYVAGGVAGGLDADNQSFVQLAITTPNTNDYDTWKPDTIYLNITSVSGPELRAALTGYTLLTPEGETEITYGYTTMGGMITFAEPSSAPDKFTYAYPEKQVLPELYVTSGATTSTSVGGAQNLVRVPLTATMRADEVINHELHNLILVGGPCANSLTATIEGSGEDCAAGYVPGKGKIKFYDNGDNVALVVAGYSGDDTRRAAKVLAQYDQYALSGSEVEVEGTTFTDMTVKTV
ncbi:MAG: hypothetical protein KAT77_00595 [Nanoarchaeota archaeon]|nr:hypothetical protein [Nanoarchaeota archaeon]